MEEERERIEYLFLQKSEACEIDVCEKTVDV